MNEMPLRTIAYPRARELPHLNCYLKLGLVTIIWMLCEMKASACLAEHKSPVLWLDMLNYFLLDYTLSSSIQCNQQQDVRYLWTGHHKTSLLHQTASTTL